MQERKALQRRIQAYIPLHGARISFMVSFVMALVVVRGVTLSTVASALNPRVLPESNEKRIKRFFRAEFIELQVWAKLLLALLPVNDKLVLTLDRTTWELGSSCINLLVLGVAYQGVAFPVMWTRLDKKGNSDTAERLALVDRFLHLVSAAHIDVIVADREFIGQAWFQGLKQRRLVLVMRVRNNTLIGSKGSTRSAEQRYAHLTAQEIYVCPKRLRVFGLRLFVSVTKSKDGELVVLVCTAAPEKALVRYSQRWSIETLFSALKTRGFNLEDTRLTTTERLDKLLALLALAFTWAHLVGAWCQQQRPLKLKAHGYLAKSLFKRGLDAQRSAILAGPTPAPLSLARCFGLLSP